MLDIDDIAVMWLNNDMDLSYTMFKHSKVGKSKFKRALVRNAIKLRKIVDEDVSLNEHQNALDHNKKIWDRLKYFLSDETFNKIFNNVWDVESGFREVWKQQSLEVVSFIKDRPKTTKTYNKNIKIKHKGRTIAEATFCDPEIIY